MLKLMNPDGFDKMYRIMEHSFPDDEYRPKHEQKLLFDNKEYKVYTFSDDNDEIIAFIALWTFDDFVYIEHFAVDAKARNLGIGGKMLSEIIHNADGIICLEVEPPEDIMTKRRVAFYERNGFVLNDYPYIQPSISKGRSSIPLMIMTHGRSINQKEFDNIKHTLYTKVYKL